MEANTGSSKLGVLPAERVHDLPLVSNHAVHCLCFIQASVLDFSLFLALQIRFRALKASDRQDLMALHQQVISIDLTFAFGEISLISDTCGCVLRCQCVPVHYESQFYDKAVDGRLWSYAATINGEGRDARAAHAPQFYVC